ncbi:MAG: menaquinone biosynthesis protein [Ferruginibacter sp.]|nr:menaquinone biosynthesis protein [Ferruginibacter sp.]
MKDKIKIAAVSYLNTKPLTYGLERGDIKDLIELDFYYPSEVAIRLLENKADIALLPVEALLSLNEYHIISDFCISTEGEVASVCLFSDVPLDQIQKIYLDYQSRTSVALLQILLYEYWNISPVLVKATEGYETKIAGPAAGLIIGDRALKQRKKSAYIYDLGTAWKAFTGKPFVFAVWVSNKQLNKAFIEIFNQANKEGVKNIKLIASKVDFSEYDLYDYFSRNISYELNEEKKEAITYFLKRIKEFKLSSP